MEEETNNSELIIQPQQQEQPKTGPAAEQPEQTNSKKPNPEQNQEQPQKEKKMSKIDLSKLSVEELEELLEQKKQEEDEREEEEVDLNTLSDYELEEVLKQRRAVAAEANKKKAGLRTVTMEEAFKLAKEYELDNEFSIKFGYPNAYTPWMRWIVDNNLDLTPFIKWINDNGRKMNHPPRKDRDGLYNGYGKITLFYDGDVIETYVNAGSSLQLFELAIAHCK